MNKSYCLRVVRPVAAVQLQRKVAESAANPNETLFVKFASAFCAACQESKKALAQAVQQSPQCLDVVELDSDIADATADAYGVRALPTVVAIRGGKVVGKMEGASAPEAYLRFFKKHGGQG